MTTQFKIKKISTQDLGEYLAQARAKVHMSAIEAAKFSGVPVKFVQALEEGRFADLPAQVYVRGFLRSICRLYHIEAGAVLEQFAAETEVLNHLRSAAAPPPRAGLAGKRLLPRFVLTPKVLTVLGLSAFGLLSAGYLYFQVNSLRRPPTLAVTSPVADGESATSHLTVSGQAEAGASVFLNDQPIVADRDGIFEEQISLAPGLNQIVIRARNKFGRESVVTRAVALAAGDKQIAGAESGVAVEVVVEGEVARIAVEADGAEVFSGTMLEGSRQVFFARGRIALSTSNAGATRVILGGKDLGLLGKKGEELRNIEFGD